MDIRTARLILLLVTITSAIVGLAAFTIVFKDIMGAGFQGRDVIFLIVGAISFFMVGLNVSLLTGLK